MIQDLALDDGVGARIEAPPTATLEVEVAGEIQFVDLELHDWQFLSFEALNDDVNVRISHFTKKRPLPVAGPPYKFQITWFDGHVQQVTPVRAMDEGNAMRLFERQRGGESYILEGVEIL